MITIDYKRSFIGGLSTLFVGVFAIQIVFVTMLLLPSWFFFIYLKVEPLPPTESGQPLTFNSYLDRYWSLDMTYNDTLFCRVDALQSYQVYSTQTTHIASAPPKRLSDGPSKWVYTSRVPFNTSTCYIHSAVYATLPFNIRKLQVVQSPIFSLKMR